MNGNARFKNYAAGADLCVRPRGCTHKKSEALERRISPGPRFCMAELFLNFWAAPNSTPKTGYVRANFPIPQLLLGSTEAMDPAKALSGMV